MGLCNPEIERAVRPVPSGQRMPNISYPVNYNPSLEGWELVGA